MIYWMSGQSIEQTYEVGDNLEEAVNALGLDEENRLELLQGWSGGDIYVGFDPFDEEIRGKNSLIICSCLDYYLDSYRDSLASI
jgi:hypothetical protein